jgi:signal peptidase
MELCLGLGFVVFWAVTLRPASLGGPATYVVVRGDSMLPDFHSGDLAVLQGADGYGQGDVIGYRIPDGEVGAGQVVLHRIVGGDGRSGYAMEGDNNPAPDPWLPRERDVAGKVWLLLPGLGRAIVLAHQPAVAGAIAVSILVMVVLARRPAGPTLRRQVPDRGGIRLHRRPRAV